MNSETIVSLLTLAGLIAMMLSMGLKVDFNDVAASMRQPRLIGLGLLANFVLVPAVTILLLRGFDASASVSAGFLILAVCPGAPVGPPFAAVAKGDVAFATGLMIVLAGLSAVLSPLLLRLLLDQLLPATELRVDYLAIVRTLLIAQIVPLGIGLSIRRWMPTVGAWSSKPVSLTANVLLLIVVAILLSREYATLSMIQGRGWTGMLLLLAASLAIGWLCGGPNRDTRKSLALTTAVRNVAVGLLIVSSNFSGTAAATAVIAYGLVSIFAALGCAFLFAALPEPAG